MNDGSMSSRPYWTITGTSLRTRIAYCVRAGMSNGLPSASVSAYGTRAEITRSAPTVSFRPIVGSRSVQ
jgi:hypothetical protein